MCISAWSDKDNCPNKHPLQYLEANLSIKFTSWQPSVDGLLGCRCVMHVTLGAKFFICAKIK